MAEPLQILQIAVTSNTSDTELHQNVKASAERNLPVIGVDDPRDQPLILCGSGPSLDDYFPAVRAMYPNAPIMALNGAYLHLQEKYGIAADYYAQLDARSCNARFISKQGDHTRFLLASQVHPDVFAAAPTDRTVMFHLNTPITRKYFPDAGVYLGSAGGTIGGTALTLAALLGFRHVCLLGYDSSYRAGRSHAPDQPENAHYGTLPVFVEDREYTTTPMMAKQVEQFRRALKSLTDICPGFDLRLFGQGLLYDYLLTGQRNAAKTREQEAGQYAELYRDPQYGMTAFRAEQIRKFLEGGDGWLLDVGTGRGETLQIARSLGYGPVLGTETVPELLNKDVMYGLLPKLPILEGAYDTVTCFEVLEHLLPEDVIPALEELARVAAKRVIVSVCTVADIRAGVDLHPSARTEEEWLETMRVAWGDDAEIRKIGDVSQMGVSPTFEYIKR